MEPPPEPLLPPQPQQPPPPYYYPLPMEPSPQPQQPPPYYYPIPMEPPPQPQQPPKLPQQPQQPQQPPQLPQPPQPQPQSQPQKQPKKQQRVRCSGCKKKSTVGPSLKEFVCSKCHLKQDVVRPRKRPRVSHPQVPCVNCKATVTVPHGLPRFPCPHCNTELQAPPPPLPEEVNEVAIEVEQEEDNGGVVGETFTDYCHKAKNLVPEAGQKPTYTGKAVLELQFLKCCCLDMGVEMSIVKENIGVLFLKEIGVAAVL
ncbi:hypothetical protein M8C21_010412 [Ambrosia artemisiifolia]|uniref:Uncharacterized protein n=1 Tax=Ambrosia artemisiifolia TaxID=4212 RepID=A0AAD5CLX3_AMBAR|nr:hypothetical protein M8C21_010412 [Ambrosia artemisiifolia]